MYRAVSPHKGSVAGNSAAGRAGVASNGQRLTPQQAAARGLSPRMKGQPDDAGGCTSFLFGNCGFGRQVDDRIVPLAATRMVKAGIQNQASQNNDNRRAVSMHITWW